MTTNSQLDTDPELATLIGRLQAGVQALEELHEPIDAAGTWPLSAVFGAEPEASWGPSELLAHVSEMLRYWLGEIERVLDPAVPADQPVPFGRLETDPLRIGSIERDRTLPFRELYARIAAESERIATRLAGLSPQEAGRRGTHPRYGETDVTAIVDRHIVDHLDRHVAQLQQILATRRA